MNGLTILADENIPLAQAYFGKQATVRTINGRTIDRSHLQGIDALLVRSVTTVDRQLLDGSKVRFVGTATSGVDHIDRDYLDEQGIAFAYAPGANANSVVEYVLAAIAAVDDHLEKLMAGGTVGVIGYGRIGKALTSCLRGLGICCQVYDPWLTTEEIPGAASLERVLNCDVISLHPELTRAAPWPSVHLLGLEELTAIGPRRLLINASRGPVVDNKALLSLHREGAAPVTVLDVWEGEPLIEPALLELVAIGSAHIAGYSFDAKISATRMLHDAFQRCYDLSPSAGSATQLEAGGQGLATTLAGPAMVRYLIEQRYQILADDSGLRQSQALGTQSERAVAFDLLRREYRQRRELRGSVLAMVKPTVEQQRLLAALGCGVLPGEGPSSE